MTLGAPPLIIVGGATATGKTALAIRLAEVILETGRPAEIISADSRQVYRGLDIGTAKASAEERRRVVHHGLDLVDPDVPFTVATFVEHVRGVLHGLAARDGVAILAGGTGFYLRSVVSGLDTERLPVDGTVRAQVRADLDAEGLERSYARLRALAPTLASSIDRANPRRVERALEIAILQGDRPLPERGSYPGPTLAIGLHVDPGPHRERIVARALAQFGAGLIEEARALRDAWDPALPAFSAIGYREAWSVIDGERSFEEAVADDAQRNSAFARRQRTFFRSESGYRWIDATHRDPVPAAAAAVHDFLERLSFVGANERDRSRDTG